MGLAVHDGDLYAGICEPGERETGHVYRYAGGARWVNCGTPDQSNAVTSLVVFEGKLYAGTGHYHLGGSALPPSKNTTFGGTVFRYEGENRWTDCGHLPNAEGVGGMTVFRGQLYATSMYKPPGTYRYLGRRDWQPVSQPSDERWCYALGVFNRCLYATSWSGCLIFRFDGETWAEPVRLQPKGQSYSFEVHRGELFTGTWNTGHVWRTGDGDTWTDAGRLGGELEVMGMAVYNGKLYAGTLPLAQVYRYDDDATWTLTSQLDFTPNVLYRRAWSMALFKGQLFCGLLPSGHVFALTAGANASYDRELKPGWKHLAAVRQSDHLKLFVDGKQVAESSKYDPSAYDLTNDEPLKIGFGGHDYFNGSLSDLQLFGRALSADEIAQEMEE
jgi:hypothetical protein